jgi:Molybdopterin-binding domain of aldehyde dehydrogenase
VIVEVAIDELLGTVRIRRIYACHDAGRIINPKTRPQPSHRRHGRWYRHGKPSAHDALVRSPPAVAFDCRQPVALVIVPA